MKKTTRILILTVAVALIAACIASVTISAVPAKTYAGIGVSQGQYISEYITSSVYIHSDFESKKGETLETPGYLRYTGAETLLFGAEESSKDERTPNRVGAEDIYANNPSKNGFVTFNYGSRAENEMIYPEKTVDADVNRPYNTMVMATLENTEPNPNNGYVIEFDFGIFSYVDDKGTEETEDDEVVWEFPGYEKKNVGEVSTGIWFEYLTTGSARDTNSEGQIMYSGEVLHVERVEGEKAFRFVMNKNKENETSIKVEGDTWIHVTWVFDVNDWTFNMYTGYDVDGRELLGSAKVNKECYPVNMRVGGRCSFGQFSLDNIYAYSGDKVHDPYYLAGMADEDRFVYLVDALVDESVPASDRYNAYSQAGQLMRSSTKIVVSENPAVKNAIKRYNALAENAPLVQELEYVAATANTAKYYELVQKAASLPRRLNNITDRSTKITEAEGFLRKCGSLVNKDIDQFAEASTLIGKLNTQITQDENAVKFIYAVERFAACNELGFTAAMRNHYNTAVQCLAATADITSYIDDAPTNANSLYKRYKNAKVAFESTGAILNTVETRANTVRFVDLVNLLLVKKNEWFTDDGSCQRLWKSAFDIIKSGQYAPKEAVGFDAAYSAFFSEGGIHDAFWAYNQQVHIETLSNKLSGFNTPGITYIGRYAIITYIDRYIKTNADTVDLENPEIAEICEAKDNYKQNLALYELDYRTMLEENSNKFMDLIGVLKEAETYEQIKPLFDQATDCYYGMDIPDDETMEAVLYYEELGERLALIESSCILFKAAVEELKTAVGNDAVYKALAKGYSCIEYVDVTIAGVREVLDEYNAVYEQYMSGVNVANGEIIATVDTAMSARSHCGIEELLYYVSTIIH